MPFTEQPIDFNCRRLVSYHFLDRRWAAVYLGPYRLKKSIKVRIRMKEDCMGRKKIRNPVAKHFRKWNKARAFVNRKREQKKRGPQE